MAGFEYDTVSQLQNRDPPVGAPLPAARGDTAAEAEIRDLSLFGVPTSRPATIIIERRTLIRDCLVKCLKGAKSDEATYAFCTVAEWLEARSRHPCPSLILLCTAERSLADIELDITLLSQTDPETSIVLLSDGEDAGRVIGALDKGARGYIPTSMSLDVAVEAMQLVRAGGTFVPASSLMASRGSIDESAAASRASRNGLLTARQSAVAEALRQGKGNKIIAYELNMRESTVKVHVRNIMKKLNAKNRTEVAFRMNGMASNGGRY